MMNLNNKSARYLLLVGLGLMNMFMFQNCSNWKGQVMVTDNVSAMSAGEDQMTPDIDLGPKVGMVPDSADGTIANPAPETPKSQPASNIAATQPNSNQDPISLATEPNFVPASSIIQESVAAGSPAPTQPAQSIASEPSVEPVAEAPAPVAKLPEAPSSAPAAPVAAMEAPVVEPVSPPTSREPATNPTTPSDIVSAQLPVESNPILITPPQDAAASTSEEDAPIAPSAPTVAALEPEKIKIEDLANPQFVCTINWKNHRHHSKHINGSLDEDNSRLKGFSILDADYDLSSIKTRGSHIIVNSSSRKVTIESLSSKGVLVLCGNFEVKKIKSHGVLVLVNANILDGKSHGAIFAFSSSFDKENDSWSKPQLTDKFAGRAESFNVFGGKITINSIQKHENHHEHAIKHEENKKHEDGDDKKHDLKDEDHDSKKHNDGDDKKKESKDLKEEKEVKQPSKLEEKENKEDKKDKADKEDREDKKPENAKNETLIEKAGKLASELVDKGEKAVSNLIGNKEQKEEHKVEAKPEVKKEEPKVEAKPTVKSPSLKPVKNSSNKK